MVTLPSSPIALGSKPICVERTTKFGTGGTATFAGGPTDLSHRDYMAWNLHRHGGSLVMIDFQDALIAPDAFDLAQLLTDRTTATLLTPDDPPLLE